MEREIEQLTRLPAVEGAFLCDNRGDVIVSSDPAVLATVTIPLARPGMGAAAALVFLTVLKELPATLLLSPPGFETLPGLIWGRTSDALYAGAALPALVLVGLALIPLVVLAWRGDPATLES